MADSLAATNAAQQDRDAMAKIREDPMFAIKKREQQSVKEIVTNPVKMRQLRELKEKMEQEHRDKRRRSASPDRAA